MAALPTIMQLWKLSQGHLTLLPRVGDEAESVGFTPILGPDHLVYSLWGGGKTGWPCESNVSLMKAPQTEGRAFKGQL